MTQKVSSSIESMIKNALITLKENHGSSMHSIKEYVEEMWGKSASNGVLEIMKKMRREGRLIQIKYCFKLSNKEISKELKEHKQLIIPPSFKTTISDRVRKRHSEKTDESENSFYSSSSNNSEKGERKQYLRNIPKKRIKSNKSGNMPNTLIRQNHR